MTLGYQIWQDAFTHLELKSVTEESLNVHWRNSLK